MSVPPPRRPHNDEDPLFSSWCRAAVPPRELRPEVLAELLRFSVNALTAGPDVPVFGSPAWCALPEGGTKTHAAIRAALAWWTEQWARADVAGAEYVAASHAVSGGEDWSRVARDIRTRSTKRVPRRD